MSSISKDEILCVARDRFFTYRYDYMCVMDSESISNEDKVVYVRDIENEVRGLKCLLYYLNLIGFSKYDSVWKEF